MFAVRPRRVEVFGRSDYVRLSLAFTSVDNANGAKKRKQRSEPA
jgi:hypothetical protein